MCIRDRLRDGVEGAAALQAQPVYENSYERLKKDRITASWLGVAGARGDLLELEEALQSALNRKWDADARSTWLLSARNSESVAELGALALSLEEAVKGLQTVAGEAHERKPWQTKGNEFIGKLARRFFDGFGASDGTIVGWLPAEGDDEALWVIGARQEGGVYDGVQIVRFPTWAVEEWDAGDLAKARPAPRPRSARSSRSRHTPT